MNAIQILNTGLDTANMISTGYLSDLTDEEMMHRPHPKCNHIKWQVGHLIIADNQMVNGCVPGTLPELPAGFADRYSKESALSDTPDDFDSKETLLDLHNRQHAALKEVLPKFTESDLDKPTPEAMQEYAPTLGSALSMIGDHWLMHAGQWAVIRRQKGREPLF